MKTFSTKPSDVRREWHVLDADGQPLGRLSTRAATYLRGKHKPTYAPHLDTGDFVIVVNASKVRLTGNKIEQKRYYHHSMYPGGLKVREVKQEMAVRPERVIERAVRGMLPKGPLGLHLFRHLKVYSGAEHPHAAQGGAKPEPAIYPSPGANAPNAPRAVAAAETPAAEAAPRTTRTRAPRRTAAATPATPARRPRARAAAPAKPPETTGETETESGEATP
jgi:large subunit ribosomal protein L13